MNDFCDLRGTPYAPVSKIAPFKVLEDSSSALRSLFCERMGFTITFFRFSEMKIRPTTAPSSFLPRLHRPTAKLEKRGRNHLLIRNLFNDQIRSNHALS